MSVTVTKMSSKGQIVIPLGVRKQIHAQEGTIFAVVGGKDSIVLKRIETPSKQKLLDELQQIAKEERKRLEAKGIKESDISGITEKSRRK